ncbi:enoyl-CoA hydratase-related protein [Halalkalibacillus halophilus]|uniref:enoyl-CoA hydratase-related protein n=1 Tax=Halalkalibacillus halophilus TaxID=392827 RepID=UPI0003FB03F7|nr:enoyl-CoA hydratase-related protein [Halalkalibacillus halophilus]
MSTVNVRLEHENRIAILTLNRPEAANALSKELLKDLNEQLDIISQYNDLRALIITASGEKAFCAGADLKERATMNEDEVIEAVGEIGSVIRKIENIEIPTIAAINGVAFGGGLELALACDLRLANEQTKMGLTETSLAIIPGAGGTQRLARIIGISKAKYYILTAKRISAQEALNVGMVESIHSQDSLEIEAVQIALDIANNGPIGVRMAKKAIDQGFGQDLSVGLQIEKECYMQTIHTEDRLEGLKAFKEKRRPKYQGK